MPTSTRRLIVIGLLSLTANLSSLCAAIHPAATIDPKIGALADHGGPSFAHALLLLSPAANAADSGSTRAEEQRGATRSRFGARDIGAFEPAVLLAPDYTITTTGGNIVITDNSGNGETLAMSQSGSNIRFVVTPTTRTYSIDGGAITAFTTPADVALAGANTITINTEAGDDIINVAAFTANLPNLTINGGTGNDAVNFSGDITFAADASLDVDLQNDDATPGADRVTLAANAKLLLSGTGAATVRVSRNVLLNNGSSIVTVNGNLTVEANQQGTPTTGAFVGVNLTGGLLQASGSGTVTVQGRGGNTGGSQYGILLHSAGKIQGGGSGAVTVQGTGGASTGSDNRGVYVSDANTRITSSGGAVSVTGQGGGSGASFNNYGVYVATGGVITAGGSGTVTVQGTGGVSTGNSNFGVFLNGTNAQITSSGGTVSVTGQGGGSGASSGNLGVYVSSGGEITAGGSGTVTVQGTGGDATGGSNFGVQVVGANTRITSSGGAVSVTGQGGGSGASSSNFGVYVLAGGEITAGGSGTVTVQGTGGAATGGNNYGVRVATTNSRITSSGGAVSVTGQGGGSSASSDNLGVVVFSGGEITAGGTGTVTVQGTGGLATGGNNYGVYVADANARITSSGGAVSVTGIEGGGASGIGINCESSGDITTAANGGDITLIANSMNIASAVSTNGSSSTTLRPYTNGVQINLGSATNPIGGPLSLSDAELDFVTTGTLRIGDANSGAITVSAAISRPAATSMELRSGGDVIFNQNVNTNGGTLLLDPGTSPAAVKPTFTGTDATAGTVSFASDLAIVINGATPGDGTGSTYSRLTVVGMVDLDGVDLVFSGAYVPVVGNMFTIVDNDGMDAVLHEFVGLPEGFVIANFRGSGLYGTITYLGGTGNDVVLTVLAPDYTTTTTGGNIVITDNSGNGETLAMSQSGGNIRFVVTPTTRTYSIDNGSAVTFATPADVALAGANAITVNTEAGNDIINVAAFTANLPKLTINGGTGNDVVNFNGSITFAPNADLDVDLQNDDATPGADRVTLAANAKLLLSGTGAATVRVSRNVLLNSGGSIETVNGNLTLEANQQGTPTTGTFVGVDLNGGLLQASGSGTVTVQGRGGNTGAGQYGILLQSAGKIQGGGSGAVTVQGTGGAAAGYDNRGVYVSGANTRITSSGGAVSVTGQGGSGSDSDGVNVLSSGEITAGGSGTVTVQGTGGASTEGNNFGVYVSGANARITSSGGAVSVTGQGGGSGASSSNLGVYVVSGGVITAGGSGTVTVQGTGGASTGVNNYGVWVTTTNSRITSSGGAVSVTGQGGGSGASSGNFGVNVVSGGVITAGGSGTVTVQGIGGAATGGNNRGVYVDGTNARITSSGGAVSVTGIEGGGPSGIGIICTSSGAITTAANGGDITLIANSMNIATAVSTNGSSSTTLRPYTNGVQINLGSATNPIGGPLSLSDAELDFVTTGTLHIGDANSGAITVSADITRPASTDMELHSAGDVLFGGGGINTNGGTLLLDPGTSPAAVKPTFTGTDATAGTVSFASDLAIVINGATPGNGTGSTYTRLTVVGMVDLDGVDLVFSGAYVPVVGDMFTIVDNDGMDAVLHEFVGLPEGFVIANFRGSGLNGIITYLGGTGNDVVMTVLAPDYTITTTGGNIVITDNSGNGETLAMSQSGGNIRFVVTPTSRTYSIDNGPAVTFATPADVVLAGANAITINTEAGDDIINVAAFTANLPKLTINGGTDNDAVNFNGDITFAANASLDVDLQNDDATPGADRVTLAANAKLLLSGTGAATVRVSRNVLLNSGSSIVTVNGNLTLEANQQTTPTSGTFVGVSLTGGLLQASGSGTVTVQGRGGDIGSSQYGILLQSAGKIQGGGSGAVTVQGTGGATTGNANHGVYVSGANARITSSGGAVSVTGQIGGSGVSSFNYGVAVANGGEITAGGSGTVTVQGTGGAATGNANHGVYVSDANARITSSGGAVSVTGQGGGSDASSSNFGVNVSTGGEITAGGSGTVTVQGTGGAATGGYNYGVLVTGTNARITSSGGAVSVTGQGGGSGASYSNIGVFVVSGGEIAAGGSGTVTVQGTGGAATGGNNYGVWVATANGRITSSGGAVSVTGQGGGSSASEANFGVYVSTGGVITASGSGTVTVQGTGGAATGGNNYGVWVATTNSRITSSGGAVSVTGIEGGGASGIGINCESSGDITTAANGGDITLIANSMNIATAVSTNGSSSTTLRPYTNGVQVNLGSATNPIGGPLSLSDAELDFVTTGTLRIGDANSGAITVSAAISRPAATSVELHSGGDVIFNQNVNTNGGALLLDPGTSPAAVKPTFTGTDATAGTVSFASDLAIVINGATPGDGTGSTYTRLTVVGMVDLDGVDLVFSGAYIPVVGNMFTIVDNDGMDAVLHEFVGLPEGFVIANFRGSGLNGTITYLGGTGNDVVITVSAVCPTITFTATPTDACGMSGDGQIAITGETGGDSPYLYSIDDGMNYQPGATFTGLSPDTYSVKIKDDNGCESAAQNVVIAIYDPEIAVFCNNTEIADGDDTPEPGDCTDFGGTTSGVPIVRTFAIHNPGGQPLVVSSIVSSNDTEFTVGSLMPASPVQAGQSATFTVTFLAVAPVPYTSTITINNNDCDEADFRFDILAAVDCVPSDITTCPGAQTVSATTNQCSAAVSYTAVVSGTPDPAWSHSFSGATTGSGSGTGSGSAFNMGMTTVVLTATNACGTSSCSFVVTVNDNQLPAITCPNPLTVTCSSNVPALNLAAVSASDNCGTPTKSHVGDATSNQTCDNRKTVTRTYRATDGSGNSTTCAQVITVYDNVAPTFSAVPANVTVQCTSIPAVGTASASDGCAGSVSVVYNGQTTTAGNCPDSYTLTRQWTATDACGNTKTATQRITVVDTQIPAFTSTPANITVQCDAIPAPATPAATDNCDNVVSITYNGQTTSSGACPNAYTITRTWTAADNCGNTKTVTQRITVVDNGKPVFTAFPGNTTISCSENPPAVGTPTASDGCGSATVAYLGQTTTSGSCPGNYQIKRTWRATDACGNSTVATQTIQVQDTGVPVFMSVPADVTIQCGQPLPPIVNPTASDACGGYVSITFLGNVPSGSGCAADYTVTRTWRAQDLCGNSALATQVITVLGNSYQEEGAEDRADATRQTTGSRQTSATLQPNPTTDRFWLDLTDFAGEAVTVSIYSDLGQLVWENRIPAVEVLKLSISLREAGAKAGIYAVSVRSASGVVAKRVVLVE